MCDVVHALLVARIEADVRQAQQAAQMSAIFGGEPEWPSLDDRLTEFEELLTTEPAPVDPEERELREALGLRG